MRIGHLKRAARRSNNSGSAHRVAGGTLCLHPQPLCISAKVNSLDENHEACRCWRCHVFATRDESAAAKMVFYILSSELSRFEREKKGAKRRQVRGGVIPHRATAKLSGSLMNTTPACM
jgi:hypothetical protein